MVRHGLPLAERQLINVTDHQTLRHVEIAQPTPAMEVVAVLTEAVGAVRTQVLRGVVDRFRPGICRTKREPGVEPPLHREIQPMIAGIAERIAILNLAEGRERQDRLTLGIRQNAHAVVQRLVQVAQRVQCVLLVPT